MSLLGGVAGRGCRSSRVGRRRRPGGWSLPGRTGCSTRSGTRPRLVAGLERVLGDSAFGRDLGRAEALETVLNKFALDRMAETYERLYGQLLARRT